MGFHYSALPRTSTAVEVSLAPSDRRTENKNWHGFTPSSCSPRSAEPRGRLSSLRVLVLQGSCCCRLPLPLGGCDLREQSEGKEVGDLPHSLSIMNSFLLPEPELQGISRIALCQLSQAWGILEEKVMVNSLAGWWYFEFLSFLICLLLFTFQNPQIAALCSLSRFYSLVR